MASSLIRIVGLASLFIARLIEPQHAGVEDDHHLISLGTGSPVERRDRCFGNAQAGGDRPSGFAALFEHHYLAFTVAQLLGAAYLDVQQSRLRALTDDKMMTNMLQVRVGFAAREATPAREWRKGSRLATDQPS